jgi:hypothetical protein
MGSTSNRPDVYIACHPEDEDWVKELVAFLRRHDLTVVSEHETVAGEHEIAKLEAALFEAPKLVLVISPEAIADPKLQFTRHASLSAYTRTAGCKE